jgi:hypothetical protein
MRVILPVLIGLFGIHCALAGGPRDKLPAAASDATRLPDWSGAWVPDLADQVKQIQSNPAPWTRAAAKQIVQQQVDAAAGRPHGLFPNCLPEGMPSWMLITHNAFEVLFTPGRVTLLGESDGNRLRRIYVDGRGHPADVDPTFHGHSIGHWEGQTLMVDTVGVLPEVLIAVSESMGLPNNGDLHVIERLHLTEPDVLHDDLTVIAPHVLSQPWQTTRVFKRYRGPGSEFVEGVCRQGDFAEGRDDNGNAVFVIQNQDNGNPVSPPK